MVDLGKKSGSISLTKGEKVTIAKTAGITATVSFSKDTDYDIYAVVLLTNGEQVVVSTFGSVADPNPVMSYKGVRHLGDVQRGGASALNTETLEIELNDEIAQVAVVAYSAQSNGTGSFRNYKVSLEVNNHQGDTVNLSADNANDSSTVYTCVPAIIHNSPEGVSVDAVELYSSAGSEKRPAFVVPTKGFLKKTVVGEPELVMDAGAKNLYK